MHVRLYTFAHAEKMFKRINTQLSAGATPRIWEGTGAEGNGSFCFDLTHLCYHFAVQFCKQTALLL